MAKSNPNIPCAIDGCTNASFVHGWCKTHYERNRLYGDPNLGGRKILSVEERFWPKVDKSAGIDGCWPWKEPLDRAGYGSFYINYIHHMAHRIAYELTAGESLGDQHLDHKCHNPCCVNPRHLRPVTRKQNMENRNGAHRNSKSGIRGVWKQKNRWRAQVVHNGEKIRLGYFLTPEEAGEAARLKRLELFTHSDGR